MRGRAPIFEEPQISEIKENILDWISEGKPLREFCRQPGMPCKTLVYDWMNADPEFDGRIARARNDGYDELAEECLEIADNATNDWETRHNKDGSEYQAFNPEVVMRSKLRIETRLKLLAKWDPKKYGDKLAVEGNLAIKSILVPERIATERSKTDVKPEFE